ncbi:MAG TPA: DDE-type integrase/transposase/recombinase [Acidimicrobiales bacterium]|jgi:putative transposase|nr:DDE-type integrase/transposase/recombinase [Acidimicrobiales bacterium]
MSDRATEVALFRYALIREAADPALSKAQRGRLVRDLAAGVHVGPGGVEVRVGRSTADQWIRAYRAGGFEGLKPKARAASLKVPAEILAMAEALKREAPQRTAAQISHIVAEAIGWAPNERTIQRHFRREGLTRHCLSAAKVAFGRFEASRPNELWVGDALHGPIIGRHKAILFAFLDDHSRLVTGYRWVTAEDTVRAEAALRWGLASRGVPGAVYLDNGSPFVSAQLLRACATLGIRLIHSRPGRPEGRGKIERFFRTVRDQFLVEVAQSDIADVARLNQLFSAWVEAVYHQTTHSETKMTPLARYATAIKLAYPTAEQLHEAFLWSETRTVTKTATVSLFANTYEVDAALVGRRVELIFDPFDLTDIAVRWSGRPMGTAVAMIIGRHCHPAARPEPGSQPPPPATGIDYLHLVEARADAELGRRISYAGIDPDDQLTIPGADWDTISAARPAGDNNSNDNGEVAR